MPRTVRFVISQDGTVETEFSGFAGEDCLDEAEALQGALRKYGLRVTPGTPAMKTTQQIEQETGVSTKPTRGKARVGHES